MAFRKAVAIIGGGASGLGWATAARVASRGGQSVIFDLPRSEESAFENIKKAGLEDSIKFVSGDITNVDDVGRVIAETVDQFGRVDLGVQTAGIGTAFTTVSPKLTHNQRVEQFSKCLTVNTVGTFNFVSQLAAQMSNQEERPENPEDSTIDHTSRGVILCTASIAAMDGQRGQAAYSASKGAIVGMTLPIARDLAKYKIRVNTIAPGLFDTPLLAALPEKARLSLAASVPHPSKLGDPAEYAALVEHIFHNPMMNAEIIRIDGALRMNM